MKSKVREKRGMDIPDYLLSQVAEGKVVLVLGAGASLEARDSKDREPPSSQQLAQLISEKFLGGKYNQAPLAQVGEYAISESDLFTVQGFIRDIFDAFRPSDAHRMMTTFKWRGLATTNYDCLIEKAYEANRKKACQMPVPFIENGDRVDDKLRDIHVVPLLKLHGCVTRISEPNCPLILSVDQYVQYMKGRSRIFEHLKDWGYERPFVFIGHSLLDSDIRAVLSILSQLAETRPRYYLVAPEKDDIQKRFWESRKITILEGTFKDFMTTLNSEISSPFRGIVAPQKEQSPICEKVVSGDKSLSTSTLNFLDIDADYVKSVSSDEVIKPGDFYRGFSRNWSAVEQNLDVRRALVDIILTNHFLEKSVPDDFQFILVKGHAGSGKSLLLRRIAWEAAKDYDCLCLYIKKEGQINPAAIQEIISRCGERIYMFIDNIVDRVYDIEKLVNSLGNDGKHLTIIGAERFNEWNMSCELLNPIVTSQYVLEYLSEKEIDGLLDLLEKHNSLGTLQDCSYQERKAAFTRRAGRQLLVALHEATLGKPFEEIIEDEFNSIIPDEAKFVYLTICVLNRLKVPVRAGIISRLHEIPFAAFKERFFKPLEHVVYDYYSKIIRDYVYSARHSHVAEIVFERILTEPEKRFDNYLKCLKELNIDYESDRLAFRKMIHARTLLDMFPNHEHIVQVYRTAENIAGDDPHLYHQMGIYEMQRPNGNFIFSAELLNKASSMNPRNPSIKHSYAELYLKRAEFARTDLEKESFLAEAEKRARSLLTVSTWNAHGYHTLVKVNLERIKFNIGKERLESYVIEQTISETEKILSDGLQQFPENSYLLDADAQIAELISDSDRVYKSLYRAFETNNRNSFVALRLARTLKYKGDIPVAQKILEKAIDANANEKKLHFAYSVLLMEPKEDKKDKGAVIAHHLKRSFSPGDKNYMAQLLYGRQLFINGDIDGAEKFFKKLRELRISHELGYKLRYKLEDEYSGEIIEKQSMFCFIARDGKRDHIFGHISNAHEEIWNILVKGSRVNFKVGFTLNGPNAYDIRVLS